MEGSGSPPELLTSCISETYFVALIISKWTPIYPWPKLGPAEVELLHEHAIIIYYDLPMTIMRRLSPQLADLEYIEASGGSAAVARYLVSILKANPQTFFKRQEQGRRELYTFWDMVLTYIQLELGVLSKNQRERLELVRPAHDLPADMAGALGINREWVRFSRETLSFLDAPDAAVAIVASLKGQEPGLNPGWAGRRGGDKLS